MIEKKKKNKEEDGVDGAQDKPNDRRINISKKKKKLKKNRQEEQRSGGAQDKPTDCDINISRKKKKKKKKKKKEKGKAEGGVWVQDKLTERGISNVITDARFSAVHSDPRFQRVPKHHSKVSLDSRFSRIFSDEAFSSSAPLDKRGKRKKLKPQNHPLHHYYHREDAEEDDDVDGSARVSSSSESETSFDDEDVNASSSNKGDSDDDGDDNGHGNASVEVDPSNVFKEDIPIIECETHRLAIVNLDWKHVKAVDLYVLLGSYLPKDGQILSVAIYPTEFGLKCMEVEAVHGPTALFESYKKQNEDDDDDDDDDDDNDDDDDEEMWRQYELNTLRYYFAVVECNSSATADHLYKTCDGVELERSSNMLDLRFIPDSMELEHSPRDIATEAPTNYEALDFHTAALQHSKIQLSWDEDEPNRKILKRKFNSEQLAEMDLKEFLASDDGESSDNGDEDGKNDDAVPDGKSQKPKKVDLYRALVQSGDGSDADDDKDKDMEVTFNTGLEDISKRILEKQKDKKSETVWEAYLRKRSEKKKARKGGSKFSSEDDDRSDSDVEVPDEPDDFFVEESSDDNVKVGKKSNKDSSDKKTVGKKHQKERKESPEAEEQEASRAELELLLADDQGTDPNLKGYNLKSKKGKKGKRGKEIPSEDNIPSIDYDDPRFSAMFTSPLFALDPTDPQFKRSATYMRQLRKNQKGHDKEAREEEEMQPPRQVQLPSDDMSLKKHELFHSDGTSLKNNKHELSSLVRRVKRKVGSLQS